jgi:peptidoglycan/LPS O-acetylase OafA/YrhL
LKYRAEIDGLRALAVLPVMFFHAGFEVFSGGFVGVDVFFVISGYLITALIISELEIGQFSILKFYERRARRILPALFLVMFLCIPFSYALLSPSDFRDFGQSLVAVSIFSSNLLFWLESDYFDIATEFKPLLHTWSLAVEEQFYLIFPLLLLALWRLNNKILMLVLLSLIFCISIIYSHWGAYNVPSFNFYSITSRAWELLIGVFLALFLWNYSSPKSIALNQFLSILGLTAICFSITTFDAKTPFPSFYALIPTLGTALIILSSTHGTLVNKLLTLKPVVGIGLISYSSYLWHQPIIAFANIYFLETPTAGMFLALIVLALLLAFVSWRFFERPFRNPVRTSRRCIFYFSTIGLLFFSLIGLSIHFNNGYEERFSKDQLTILNFENSRERDTLYRNRVCFLRKDQDFTHFQDECFNGDSYIWGDSHSAALSHGLLQERELSQLTASACPPILDFNVTIRRYCKDINSFTFEKIKQDKPKFVFLHANWISDSYENFELQLENTLLSLLLLEQQTTFIIIGGIPQWQPSLPRVMFKSINSLESNIMFLPNNSIQSITEKDNQIQKIISNLDSPKLQFISLIDSLCINNKCLIRGSDQSFEPLVSDSSHLTKSGSQKLAKVIENFINQIESK